MMKKGYSNCWTRSALTFVINTNNVRPNRLVREPGYIPKYDIVTDPIAIKLLTDFIKRSVTYKKPSDYVYGRDTFLVESFNNVALIYLDKRIHYIDETYTVRRNLAVLDWNEHVSRPYTSSLNCQTVRHQPKGKRKTSL